MVGKLEAGQSKAGLQAHMQDGHYMILQHQVNFNCPPSMSQPPPSALQQLRHLCLQLLYVCHTLHPVI